MSAGLIKPVKQSELFDAIVRGLGVTATEDEPSRRETREANHFGTLRILLAEDNLINQKLALGVLGTQGHEVTVVANGREAVQAVSEAEFDMVLMDVQMPEMDGLEATKAIREAEQSTGRRVPVVAMTAHAMAGDREMCLNAGMDSYVSKPIRISKLMEAFESVLKDAPAGPASGSEAGSNGDSADSVVDWNQALGSVNGDEALLRDLLAAVLLEVPPLLKKIREAIHTQDAPGLHRAAHSLKGALLFLAVDGPLSRLRSLEKFGKHEDLDGAEPIFPELERDMEALIPCLQQYLRES